MQIPDYNSVTIPAREAITLNQWWLARILLEVPNYQNGTATITTEPWDEATDTHLPNQSISMSVPIPQAMQVFEEVQQIWQLLAVVIPKIVAWQAAGMPETWPE